MRKRGDNICICICSDMELETEKLEALGKIDLW